MTEREIHPLLEVLRKINEIDNRLTLYFTEEPPFKGDSPCGLFDADEEEIAGDGTELGFPAEDGENKRWKYGLSVKDAMSVMRNATNQKPSLSDSDRLEAFNHYMKNDAYIRFEG